MAIDTAAKRRSVAHIARHWSGAGVAMDATPDAAWRQAVGRSYIGIAAGEAAVEVSVVGYAVWQAATYMPLWCWVIDAIF